MSEEQPPLLTLPELYFLASLAQTPAGQRSASVLATALHAPAEMIPGGIGGLTLRGHLSLDHGVVKLSPTVKAIAGALARGEIWTRVECLTDSDASTFVLISSATLSLSVMPAGLGIYEVGVVETAGSITAFAADLADEFLARSPAVAVGIVVTDLVESRTVVLRSAAGDWRLSVRDSVVGVDDGGPAVAETAIAPHRIDAEVSRSIDQWLASRSVRSSAA